MSDYDVRAVPASETHDLRRAMLDRAQVERLGDDTEASLHVGGFRDEVLAGVATVTPRRMPNAVDRNAWQVSAIAVDHGHRGWGLGGLMLERLLEHAAAHQAALAWCDVPAAAFGFFERYGFSRIDDPFARDGIPHYRMAVRFAPADSR